MRRILTIDGGGIKGVFPAAFLATLEEEIGAPV
ncbi:MAG: patatin, partial [Alphaproteobacteria bacterium]|nr:patatin [Alphaproteobacteria bacterium]